MSEYEEVIRALHRCAGQMDCFSCPVDGKIDACPWMKQHHKCLFTFAAEAIHDLIKSVHIRDKHLDELNQYIQKLEAAQPHWVSVEQPPKEHMWCFVFTDEPKMIMPIRIAFYVARCSGKGFWYHYESGSDITDEVDYWTEMLLEGPKLDHDLPWPIEPPQEVHE